MSATWSLYAHVDIWEPSYQAIAEQNDNHSKHVDEASDLSDSCVIARKNVHQLPCPQRTEGGQDPSEIETHSAAGGPHRSRE